MKNENKPPDLPVEPARLRRQFPALTEEDLESYVRVTRRILGERDARKRARVTREVLDRGRKAREQGAIDEGDRVALGYLAAVEKMQGRGPS